MTATLAILGWVPPIVGHPFMRNAFLAGTGIAAGCGAVGYFVVLRSQVFTGDALSHVAFTLTFAPSVSQGQLVLTPSGFEVAGFNVSAETIRRRFGSLAAGILAPRTMCVASYFPKGLTLTGIQISQTAIVTDFAVDPRIATDPSLQAKGTCP